MLCCWQRDPSQKQPSNDTEPLQQPANKPVPGTTEALAYFHLDPKVEDALVEEYHEYVVCPLLNWDWVA